jgi:hypothetical protein
MPDPPGIPWSWGATAEEWSAAYPCDALVPAAPCRAVRAVDAAAPPERVFRWLCQLRVAPYSYDLVDNLGRRSPRALTPGLDRLRAGQSFIGGAFRLVQHEDGRELTIVTAGRLAQAAPRAAMTYRAGPGPHGSRLIGVLAVDGRRPGLWRHALAWGDLVMMRRQLRTLATLAAAPPR